ncbi:hypothetical protein GLOTRDRAFT_112645, partial [Gloeophyllum trabeum ATCC 11539]
MSSPTPPPPPPHGQPQSHAHTSTSEVLSHTPPVSSPLNPSGHSSPSPNATPTQKPLPLPPTAHPSGSSTSLPAQISGPPLRGRPRGTSISTVRNPSPNRGLAFPSLERVASQPSQHQHFPTSLASSASSLAPIDHERARSASITVASLRHHPASSRSP